VIPRLEIYKINQNTLQISEQRYKFQLLDSIKIHLLFDMLLLDVPANDLVIPLQGPVKVNKEF
jgi:hypothetical protein